MKKLKKKPKRILGEIFEIYHGRVCEEFVRNISGGNFRDIPGKLREIFRGTFRKIPEKKFEGIL